MKKILSRLFFLLISLSLLVVSCKKESASANNPPGPEVLLHTEGFLCTMGIGRTGSVDTLTFYFTTSGQEIVNYLNGHSRPEDKVHITNNGNSTISIQKDIPYVQNGKNYNYFGIQKNTSPTSSTFPSNEYLFYFFYDASSTETEFIVKRDDVDNTKFTIESKSHPGYYLGTAKWQYATYPTEAKLVFTSKKQKFFFMVQ
ncbi:MAG: hypothetical protein ABIN67_22920 [Ferruginibacter sp.]